MRCFLARSEKLWVSFNPYTYARVAVMKSRLLKKEDYHKLLKMGYHEIVRYLQEADYHQEIEKRLLQRRPNPTDIEIALNENLLAMITKLYKISDEVLRKVIIAYMLRYELRNIKAVVRSKIAKIPPHQAEELFFPSFYHFRKEFLQELLQKQELQEIVEKLPFLKKKQVKENDLFALERLIDEYYIETIHEFASQLQGNGRQLAKFLQEEIENINIRTILLLIKEHKQKINENLVRPSHLIRSLAEKASLPEIVAILRKHHRTSLTGEEENLAERIDIDLDVTLLSKEGRLLRENRLNANYLIGYLLSKEIEVKNLIILLKGKLLQVTEAQVENLLVIPS